MSSTDHALSEGVASVWGMTVAMNHEPPAGGPPPGPDEDEALTGYNLAEQAGLTGVISVSRWDAMPEDFCRDHELDRGRLITRQSGSRGHQSASRRLANALEKSARLAVSAGLHDCLTVNQDLDVRLWDVPGTTVRRPDVLVYRCLSRGESLWASHVLLVVEIVSPSSEATDTGRDNLRIGFESKMTQYASAGVRHYWIVRLKPDDSAIDSIEEWHLDLDPGVYVSAGKWVNGGSAVAVRTKEPFFIQATWADLEF